MVSLWAGLSAGLADALRSRIKGHGGIRAGGKSRRARHWMATSPLTKPKTPWRRLAAAASPDMEIPSMGRRPVQPEAGWFGCQFRTTRESWRLTRSSLGHALKLGTACMTTTTFRPARGLPPPGGADAAWPRSGLWSRDDTNVRGRGRDGKPGSGSPGLARLPPRCRRRSPRAWG